MGGRGRDEWLRYWRDGNQRATGRQRRLGYHEIGHLWPGRVLLSMRECDSTSAMTPVGAIPADLDFTNPVL